MVKTLKHLSYLLKVRQDDLAEMLEDTDRYYYRKEEQKLKNGVPKLKNGIPQVRILYPSIGKLKVVQKRLCRTVLRMISLPDYAHGSIRGRDNISNAKLHVGKKYMFTTDLKAFFPSIDYRWVYEMFVENGFSPDVACALTKLTTYNNQVPQGAPTSSLVANLVFARTGRKLMDIAEEHNLTFTTYVDDITFSSTRCFKSMLPSILKIVRNDGFLISDEKTNYRCGNKEVTGVAVGQNGLSITNSFKRKLKAELDTTTPRYIGMNNYRKRVYSFNSKKVQLIANNRINNNHSTGEIFKTA